jgi:hypothetical protein
MVNATLCHQGSYIFFENTALHYLCRPTVLENTNPFLFYTMYEVCRKNKDHSVNGMAFVNTEHFSHSSFDSRLVTMLQAVKQRDNPLLLKVSQWYFCGAKDFNGNILNDATPITKNTESYACIVLMLFLPYRCKDDLKLLGSYTKKLRSCHFEILDDSAKMFLQNIQNTRSNFYHCKQALDEFQERSIPYKGIEFETFNKESDDEEEDEEEVDNERIEAISSASRR